MDSISDRDPGDEHQEREEPVTVAQVLEQYPFIILQTCTVCGEEKQWIPTGRATLEGWIRHFLERLAEPYVCSRCG
jgi:hypothetical protein